MPKPRITEPTQAEEETAAQTDAMADLDPDHAEAGGGGLPDDFDGTIRNPRFRIASKSNYTQDGSADDPDNSAVVFSCELEIEGAEKPEEVHISNGSVLRLVPTEDGDWLQKAAGSKYNTLSTSTNFYVFQQSLKNAGLPYAKYAGHISKLDGVNAHFLRVPQQERGGLAKSEKQIEREKRYGPPKVLTVTAINSTPWDEKPATTTKKAAPAGTSANGSAKGETRKLLISLLSQNPKGILLDDVPSKAFPLFKTSPSRAEIMDLIQDTAFHEENTEAGHYIFDGKKLRPVTA